MIETSFYDQINCGKTAFLTLKVIHQLSWITPPPISMLDQKMCLENIDAGGKEIFTENCSFAIML